MPHALSFYRFQNFLSQPKNLIVFSASSKIFVPTQKIILLNANNFLSGTKCLRLPQYVNKFLVWHKKFGPAQNIFGPVKGQGINVVKFLGWLKKFWDL